MRRFLTLIVLSCALGAPAAAQHAHDHAAPGAAALKETGQAGFAALAEIVALLEADPDTDWRRVDLDALRDHLADMNALVLATALTRRDVPGGVEITLPDRPENAAAWRMVPPHSRMLAAETGWIAATDRRDGALIWTVTGAEAERIRGLGFWGLMATGAHHQAHHLALATGRPMH